MYTMRYPAAFTFFILILSGCGGGGAPSGGAPSGGAPSGGAPSGGSNPVVPVTVLDTTFGLDNPANIDPAVRRGYTLHDNSAVGISNDFGRRIVVDGNGQLYVVGGSNLDMALWRYNTNGTLDTTFGDDDPSNADPAVKLGYVVHSNAAAGAGVGSDDQGNAITIDGTGRIVIAGQSRNASTNYDMVLWRYNTNGTLDTTFGDDDPSNADPAIKRGFTVHNSAAGGNNNDAGLDLSIDGNGRIVVTGYSYRAAQNTPDMALWRYNTDGTLDLSFGDDDPNVAGLTIRKGFAVFNNAASTVNTEERGLGVKIDGNGKILVVGDGWNGANFDMVLWRCNTDGTLDTTFGDDDPNNADPAVKRGITVSHNAAGGAGNDGGSAIAINSNGRIIVAGSSYRAFLGSNDMVLWRYNTNGTLDTTFGDDDPINADPAIKRGITVQADAAGGTDANAGDYAFAIKLDASGRLLVTGQSRNTSTNYDMVLWRYNTNGTLDSNFGDDDPNVAEPAVKRGYTVQRNTAGGTGDDAGIGIALDGDGKILVVGTSTNSSGNSDMVLWRFLP